MARPYFIAPFRPDKWDTSDSDLEIDPEWYKSILANRWPATNFPDPHKGIALAWTLPVGEARVHGELHRDGQVITMDLPVPQFFLWHRSVIDAKYDLFLFPQNMQDTLQLTAESKLEEIEEFVAKY